MKTGVARIVLGLFATAAISGPVQAQDEDNELVEQGFFDDVGKVLKDVGKKLKCGLVGEVPIIGDVIADAVKCNKPAETPAGGSNGGTGGVDLQAIPAGELRPSLTVNFVKLVGNGEEMTAEASTPDTAYKAGDGFALIVQNTAPGYLEIWSISDQADYVEGAFLPKAGALVLPKTVQGLYRLSGNSPEDYVRFRFHPCEPQLEQAFEIEENQDAAELTGKAAQAVARLSERLPACAFTPAQINAAIKDREPQDQLFRTALTKALAFDTEQSAYLIESDRVRPMVAEIELKRR